MPAIKKWSFRLLKWAIILLIFVFLFAQAFRNDAFTELLKHEKRWGFLALAVFCNLASVLFTFFRWQLLIRDMGISLSLWETFRLGFVGYLFNLAPAGIVSGDLVKVFMLAHRYPEMKEKGAASVIVDRGIGLYVMFLVAAGAIWWTGFWERPEPIARLSTQIILWLVVVSSVAAVLSLLPGTTRTITGGRFRRRLAGIPAVGDFLVKLVEAFQLYRERPWTLLVSVLLTFPVHIILALAVYCIARGLFAEVPAIMEFQVMHPVANLTSMIPLAAGPYEMVLDALFPLFFQPMTGLDALGPGGSGISGIGSGIGFGLIVALGYRLTCVAVAGIGMVFYLVARREITTTLAEETGNAAGQGMRDEEYCSVRKI